MDSTERWSKRPNSTIMQRNVDKELQRIKSLAVVSVLNKNFNKETSRAQAPSPSSSLTTDDELQENSSIKNRSRSISHNSSTSEYPLKKTSNASLSTQFNQNIIPSLRARSDAHTLVTSGQEFITSAETESNEEEKGDSLVMISSPIEINKETLIQRFHELQILYDTSLQDLKESEDRNDAQKELVMIQDKLIQNMSFQLDSLDIEETESSYTQSAQYDDTTEEEGKQALYNAQNELQSIKKELHDFASLKDHYEKIISEMTQQLSAHNDKMIELEGIAMQIKKENATQVEYIDTKVQTLVNKLLETNETINRLQVEHFQERQQAATALAIHNTSSINESSSIIWETFEEDDEPDSARSSFISLSPRTEPVKKKSLISRWKGNSIPPAAPPPSLPLPPIPSNSSSRNNRPKSTLSELYASSSSVLPQNRHVSMDAVGGSSNDRRYSNQSEIEVEMTDAAYYKEFTDQLQERLSVSKEIDDLRVWEPSDYDEIQRKIDSKGWSGSEDGHSQKDQSAFWKGMKKKLRV